MILISDEEIEKYLLDNGFIIKSHDGIMDIFNTSYQIIDSHYNPDTGIMTITTPNNTFSFLWQLGTGN